MNKKTYSKACTAAPLDTVKEGEADVLDMLQTFWDKQDTAIDRAFAYSHCDAPLQKSAYPTAPYRTRLLVAYIIFSTIGLGSAIYWGILIPTLVFSTASLVISLAVELEYIMLAAVCLYRTVCLLIYNPSRVGVLRMSRPASAARMMPNTATSRVGNPDASRPISTPQHIPTSAIFISHIGVHARYATAACIAAVVALGIVSFTTTGIDGYSIAQNHHGRAAAVEVVAQMINHA